MLSVADKYEWFRLNSVDLKELRELKNQIHHLVIAVSSVGRTFMDSHPRDENATLIWIPGLWRIAGRWVPANQTFRSSVSFEDASVLLVNEKVNVLATFHPEKRSHNELLIWLEQHIINLELSSSHLRWDLPFPVPNYPTFSGSKFEEFDFDLLNILGGYFHNAFYFFSLFKEKNEYEEDILIWPRDLHMKMDVILRKTDERETDTFLTLGFSPGDSIYDEPYFYVTSQPFAKERNLSKLKTQGFWYKEEWIGAVYFARNLWGSSDQMSTLNYFFDDAISKLKACLLQ